MRPGRDIARLVALRPGLAVAWFGLLGACLASAVLRDDRRVWAYVVVSLVLTAVVAAVDRYVEFSDVVLRLMVVVGALHLAGGLLPAPDGDGVLYDAWLVRGVLRVDQAVHFAGSAVGAAASWQVLGTWLDLERTAARTQAVLAALAGLGKGAINEVFEFLLALRVPGTFVGGFENTGWDLVFDLAGVTAAALFLVRSGAARRPTPRAASAADRPRLDREVDAVRTGPAAD